METTNETTTTRQCARCQREAYPYCPASHHEHDAANAAALVELRTAYLVQIRQLIATYPAQAQNEAHYLLEVARSRLGRMRRDVETKGGHSVYRTGDLVLAWPSLWLGDDSSVWHGRNSCTTVVNSYAVEVIL